jgi:outer membrane receptor for ferrienterochelin and colicin
VNDTQKPPTVSLGNPDLKPEHANNFDLLLEQYLAPLGLIQAGYFYKALGDPIIATQTRPTSGPYAGYLVSQPGNAGSARLQGFEIVSATPRLPARRLRWIRAIGELRVRRHRRAAYPCGTTSPPCCGRRRIPGTSARPTTMDRCRFGWV